MKLSVIFFVCISLTSLGQIPAVECKGDSLYSINEIRVSRNDTTHYVQTGWMRRGKKEGVWLSHYSKGADTSKHFLNYSIYNNDRTIKRGNILEKGIIETSYNLRGFSTEIVHYDNFGIIGLKTSHKYMGQNRRYTTMYYPNGKVMAEGRERRLKVIAGCDSGMRMFKRIGKWKYHNSDGDVEIKEEKINEFVFEKVRRKV